jgi:protein O-mannosyl-transferase
MRKSKPSREAKSAAPGKQAAVKQAAVKQAAAAQPPAAAAKPDVVWWPWAAGLAGLILAFVVYDPALNAGFVFDDRFLPFFAPNLSTHIGDWVGSIRPLLMFSFWLDYVLGGGGNPYIFHATNVIFHFLTSVMVALIAAQILDWAGVAGRMRATLAVFSGALFLLHPLQTESVAYVASRSENLSVLFYYAAFTLFVYRRNDSMTILRAVAIVALFGAAVATKEHTLTLPALFLLTDFFWDRGGIRKNAILYVLLAVSAAVGAVFVLRVLRSADTAGFALQGLSPAAYFFTQCRVLWDYVRMFALPFGQNVDPDIPVSTGLLDHGAIFGLVALIAAAAAAWIYRKRFPLAAFGVFVFLLLIAPTSSLVPIRDVLAERRLYLPFLGLIFIALEFLRRIDVRQAAWVSAAILAVCAILTYQRSEVWASPLALWEDSVAKSPAKYRPRFQLAYAQFELSHCAESVQSYEKASQLGPVDDQLLIDWALALDCANRPDDAVARLRQALQFRPSAHVYSQIGMIYAKRGRTQDALTALDQAEKINPGYEMIYVYRGNIALQAGDRAGALREYQHALNVNPSSQAARDALLRVSR